MSLEPDVVRQQFEGDSAAMSANEGGTDLMRQAWDGFFDRLRDEAELLLDGDAETEEELAEGLLHLAHKAAIALQWRLEFVDPDFPVLFRTGDDRLGVSHQCIDMTYLRAQVHGDNSYRLHGEPGFSNLLVSTYEGDYSHTPIESFISERRLDELAINPDGSIDIMIGSTHEPGNWLALRTGAACLVMLRQLFADWTDPNIPGFFTLDRIDGPNHPVPLTPGRLTNRLQDATGWLERRSLQHHGSVARPRATVNSMTPASALASGGSANGAYSMGYFVLNDDQCLLIELQEPKADYWGLIVYNIWGELPNLQDRQSSLNCRQVYVDADGIVRIVVSPRDIGHPNWLDTGGRTRGSIWYRLYFLEGSATEPTSRVVSIDQLWDEVPVDTPRLELEARRSALLVRRQHLARRFQR